MKKFFLFVFGFFVLPHTFASQIGLLDSAKLAEMSDVIVIGKVVKVKELSTDAPYGIQEVTVQVKSHLKDKLSTQEFSLKLSYKGMKDFDPEMKMAQTAIFFLKRNPNKELRLAYPGAIAIFPMSHIR